MTAWWHDEFPRLDSPVASEPTCAASQAFGYSREGLVCTLPKGHQGEHVDHSESIAWHWIDEITDPVNGSAS